MGLIAEFKEFVSRGSVVDLAVGVVIGAAFGKIVTALVDGIVMPFISMVTGGAMPIKTSTRGSAAPVSSAIQDPNENPADHNGSPGYVRSM